MAYLRCQYLPFTQIVLVPDLWDQLGFLVTKILGGDSYSRFPLKKEKNSLSPYIFPITSYLQKCMLRRDAAHVRQVP